MSCRAFCNTCAAEVEDAGGFCLLGHRLSALVPPPPPPPLMTDLKQAVAEVFEEAARAASAGRPQETAKVAAPEAPQPPPSRYASSIERTWAELESAPAPAADDPIYTFAPPPRMDWGPRRSAFRLKLRRERAEASV